MFHRQMQLACVFRPVKVRIATTNFMNCHSQNVTSTNAHSKNQLATLSTLMKNQVRGQGNFYVKISVRYCSADTKQVKGKQKLLDCGFKDLYKELHLASASTDITKAVKFVLDQKIEVSKNNIKHSDIKPYVSISNSTVRVKCREQYGFKQAHFTKGDDKIIQDNWAQLVMLSGVKDPKALLEQLKDKKLSNVLSCVLSKAR